MFDKTIDTYDHLFVHNHYEQTEVTSQHKHEAVSTLSTVTQANASAPNKL